MASPEIARPDLTRSTTRGAARVMCDLGFIPVPEVTLKSGRRADLMGLDRSGRVMIVEVKSSLEDYRADRKWQGYLEFCDLFLWAVPPDFPRALLDQEDALPGRCGLIIADSFDGAMVRQPDEVKLAAARRKALTLRLARLAAGRLWPETGLAPTAGIDG